MHANHSFSPRWISDFTLLRLFLVAMIASAGCGPPTIKPSNDPEAKKRLEKVLRLYQAYLDKNKKGPANEQALREFGQKLTEKERDELLIGNDLDGIFTSPRDKEKFEVIYNLKFSQSGQSRAVAWEAKGQDGRRFVALSMGYVEEYDDETFKEYKK